jgi:cell pole-organizing protein PopZ
MSQSAKAQEPSMEEILASIRRIIADDDQSKPPPKPAAVAPPPPARPAAPPPPPPKPAAAAPLPTMNQNEVDAMMANLDAPPGGEPAAEEPEVLELTESMAQPDPARSMPHFQTIDGQPDVIFADAPASEPAPRVPEEPRRPAAAAPATPTERPLLSQTTTAAVDMAFNSLAQTVLVQNARTLEDLVREMLRPMLKVWLDDNLPSMVERMVRAEIERVSRSR